MEIEIVALSKDYGKMTALNSLTMTMSGTGCVGYLGPNGAGKTTTLKILTHLIMPTSGDATINGYSVVKDYTKALKDVGALVETPNFYPYLTPTEVLEMLSDVRGIDRKEIRIALEEVDMWEWKDKKVGKFSKGMKQRIAMATAILGNPEILILDEPTTGMDPRGMAEMRYLINNLKKDRLVFMSSHLLSEVQEVCDRVAMLNRGRLMLHDTVDAVSKRFNDRFIIVEFAGPVDSFEFETPHIKNVEVLGSTKVRLEVEGGLDEQHLVLKELMDRGYRVVAYRQEGMALEKAYLEMMEV